MSAVTALRVKVWAIAIAAIAALTACSETDPYLIAPAPPEPVPIADSPRDLMLRFVWHLEHRDTTDLESQPNGKR